MQVFAQFPQQVYLQAVPVAVNLEADGREHGTAGHPDRLAAGLGGDVRETVGLDITVREPVILELVHGSVGFQALLGFRHGLRQFRFVFREHETGGITVFSQEGDFDIVFPLRLHIEDHFVGDRHVHFVVDERLQDVAFCVVSLQGDVVAGRQFHIIAAPGCHAHPQARQVCGAAQFNAVILISPTGGKDQGAQGGQDDSFHIHSLNCSAMRDLRKARKAGSLLA